MSKPHRTSGVSTGGDSAEVRALAQVLKKSEKKKKSKSKTNFLRCKNSQHSKF